MEKWLLKYVDESIDYVTSTCSLFVVVFSSLTSSSYLHRWKIWNFQLPAPPCSNGVLNESSECRKYLFHIKQYTALYVIIFKAYAVCHLGTLCCCSAQWCGKIAVSQHSCMTTFDETVSRHVYLAKNTKYFSKGTFRHKIF